MPNGQTPLFQVNKILIEKLVGPFFSAMRFDESCAVMFSSANSFIHRGETTMVPLVHGAENSITPLVLLLTALMTLSFNNTSYERVGFAL